MFRILIAEDDRELFSRTLEKHGYATIGVSDGRQALKALEDGYVDLIISDIMMPVMDGYEMVRALRDTGNMTPVLMITAKGTFDDMNAGFSCGADDYMVKPILDAYSGKIAVENRPEGGCRFTVTLPEEADRV